MRILITGVTGRVGSRYLTRLTGEQQAAQSSDQIRVVLRDPELAASFWDRGLDVVVGDLRDSDTVQRAVDGMDGVVHLAATFRGATPVDIAETNRDTAIELARAALDAGVGRFVFASTNLVYGPGRGRPAHEDDVLAPAGPYPVSKAAAERALLDLHASAGLGLRIVRLSFVYGDGDPHLTESVGFARDRPAHWRLHMVHHADVAQGLTRALRTAGADGRIFNLADDAPITGWELLALNGVPAPWSAEQPGELADPWQGIVDTRRIRAELGYRPIYPTVYAAR
jgi:nucleoside-diphosphate-sugar epimerase